MNEADAGGSRGSKALNEEQNEGVGQAKDCASKLDNRRTYATNGCTLGDDLCEFPEISLRREGGVGVLAVRTLGTLKYPSQDL
jgi:hypothetical protein